MFIIIIITIIIIWYEPGGGFVGKRSAAVETEHLASHASVA
jgi:hypothetical protein